MTLLEQILSIYPQLTAEDFLGTITLQDDGSGAYIKSWSHALAQPTPAQLAAAVLVPRVPQVVSRFQAKAALSRAGHLASVETMMASAPAETKMAWQDAIEFRRQSPTVLSMGAALGLTSAQMDALFITAAGIEA